MGGTVAQKIAEVERDLRIVNVQLKSVQAELAALHESIIGSGSVAELRRRLESTEAERDQLRKAVDPIRKAMHEITKAVLPRAVGVTHEVVVQSVKSLVADAVRLKHVVSSCLDRVESELDELKSDAAAVDLSYLDRGEA